MKNINKSMLLALVITVFGNMSAYSHDTEGREIQWMTSSNARGIDCKGATFSEATLYGPASFGLGQSEIDSIVKLTLAVDWRRNSRNQSPRKPDLTIPTAVVPANTSLQADTATKLTYRKKQHEHIKIDPAITYVVLTSAKEKAAFGKRIGRFSVLAEFKDDRPAEFLNPIANMDIGKGRCNRIGNESISATP